MREAHLLSSISSRRSVVVYLGSMKTSRVRSCSDMRPVDSPRVFSLLTETIAAVNSSLDLQEVLELVASKVADALGTDACFVYLYDERADELVLRATFGTRVEELTRTPRMRPGEGITGVAAAERAPVMIAAQAHLDARFKQFPNLPEDEYESILAVPILARDTLEGALNVRTREPRAFTDSEIELLVAIASQVAQTIEHAKLYERAQRRVAELEALARISEAVSESLYLEESLEAIVKTTMESLHATGAALVLEDGKIAWPEGRAGAYAVRLPLRWKRRQIGELVCDRDTPFSPDDEALAGGDRAPCRGCPRARASRHARRARSGDPPPREEQPAVGRLAPAAAGARRERRCAQVAERLGQQDPRHRRSARGPRRASRGRRRPRRARRSTCARCSSRVSLRARTSRAELEHVSLAGQQATALALVFTELFQNALEHGGEHVSRSRSRSETAKSTLTIADDGAGILRARRRVRASPSFVRSSATSFAASLSLENVAGLRAEVVFPA